MSSKPLSRPDTESSRRSNGKAKIASIRRVGKEGPSLKRVEDSVKQLLGTLSEEFGLDLQDPNFKETPRRVAAAYAEIFAGLRNTDEQIAKILSSAFPSRYRGMVLVKDIRVWSVCPHHLFEVAYRIDLAYLPAENGYVIGLSKLPRIVELLAKRPVLQETLTEEITDALMSIKKVEGAACLVRGKHSCMGVRGTKKPDAVTITSSIRGAFEEEDATRAEFLTLIRDQNEM
jgi:GTP cyclohydrolase IA